MHEDSGFTFADFINVLAKRWKLFASIIILFLVIGTVYFKSRPLLPFVYRTTIEVGTKADGIPIEQIEAVKVKFSEAYIPEVLAAHAKEQGYDDQRYFVEIVEPPKGEKSENVSSITLRSTGSKETAEVILEIHQRIAKRFIDDHAHQVGIAKQALQQQNLQAELALEGLKDEEQRIPRKQELLDNTAELLKKQIDAAQNIINIMEQDRARAIVAAAGKESVDQSLATTFLLLDSAIVSHRGELRSLEERLFVKLTQERAELDREEAELKRKQKEQKQLISDSKFQIDNFRASRILLNPSQLPRPPLAGVLYQTLAIFGGAGFILGLFLTVFVEFAVKARKEARSR